MDFELLEDHTMIKEMVKDFAKKEELQKSLRFCFERIGFNQ